MDAGLILLKSRLDPSSEWIWSPAPPQLTSSTDYQRLTLAFGPIAGQVTELTSHEWQLLPPTFEPGAFVAFHVSDESLERLASSAWRQATDDLGDRDDDDDDTTSTVDPFPWLHSLVASPYPWAVLYTSGWEDIDVVRGAQVDEALEYLRDELLGRHTTRGFLFFSLATRR